MLDLGAIVYYIENIQRFFEDGWIQVPILHYMLHPFFKAILDGISENFLIGTVTISLINIMDDEDAHTHSFIYSFHHHPLGRDNPGGCTLPNTSHL